MLTDDDNDDDDDLPPIQSMFSPFKAKQRPSRANSQEIICLSDSDDAIPSPKSIPLESSKRVDADIIDLTLEGDDTDNGEDSDSHPLADMIAVDGCPSPVQGTSKKHDTVQASSASEKISAIPSLPIDHSLAMVQACDVENAPFMMADDMSISSPSALASPSTVELETLPASNNAPEHADDMAVVDPTEVVHMSPEALAMSSQTEESDNAGLLEDCTAKEITRDVNDNADVSFAAEDCAANTPETPGLSSGTIDTIRPVIPSQSQQAEDDNIPADDTPAAVAKELPNIQEVSTRQALQDCQLAEELPKLQGNHGHLLKDSRTAEQPNHEGPNLVPSRSQPDSSARLDTDINTDASQGGDTLVSNPAATVSSAEGARPGLSAQVVATPFNALTRSRETAVPTDLHISVSVPENVSIPARFRRSLGSLTILVSSYEISSAPGRCKTHDIWIRAWQTQNRHKRPMSCMRQELLFEFLSDVYLAISMSPASSI